MRLLLALCLFATACSSTRERAPEITRVEVEARPAEPRPADPPPPHRDNPTVPDLPPATPLQTGAERLVQGGFQELRGLRVGLIANHTTTVGERHLADLLHAAPGVRLVALFGPEHGVRGDADAGDRIADGRDPRTGVPVFSLYGRHRAPTDSMMAGLDVLVFDVQDVGARFYTYISTMGLAMQSAARKGIPFVVLDRPNPLGGVYAGGFTLEPAQASFVGQFTIPQAHGVTVGELARIIKGEALLPGLARLDLRVVSMSGWNRPMLWPETGRTWVPTSPNIPTFETALVYAGTCLFEGTAASEGRGTREPFLKLGAPWANAERLAADLNGRGLPGVRFHAVRFTPESIAGMSASPKLRGQALGGIHIAVTDPGAVRPVELGIHALDAFLAQAPDRAAFFERPSAFDRLAGTPRLRTMLTQGARPEAVIAAYQSDVRAWETRRRPYLLYP
jgi:uncharacterized protein YbbC (DUF1343 family)